MAYVVLVHATFANKADADHIYDQAMSVATNASIAHIGEETEERTSHAMVAEEQADGSLVVDRSWHVDTFGIIRSGEPDMGNPPNWIQPTGAQDAYPAQNVRGDVTRVRHDSKTWENSHGNGNTWVPGQFGWTEVADEV